MRLLDILKKNADKTTAVKTKGGKVLPFSLDTWSFKTFDKSVLEMDITLACIDAIAKNTAKIRLKAVKRGEGVATPDTTSDVARVLKRPNRYMTAYDFLYKVTALLLTSDNAFVYPEYDDKGRLQALWPIAYESFKLVKGSDNRLYASFQLNYFRTYTAPYEDLIHLRQHYITDDLFGASHDALKPVCALIETQDQGIINGIKNSAVIRGILKATGVLKESTIKEARDAFIKDNLSAQNNGGVMFLDSKFDYQHLDSKPYVIDAETMQQSKRKVLDFFHISQEFLDSSYTPEQYEAIYEGVLEPLAIQISQALTIGLYTERERAFGAEIEAEMDRVKYQSMGTVVNIITATSQLGLFTRDEYREMLGYAPLGEEAGGSEIMVAVNNYQADKDTKGDATGGDKNDKNK